MSYEQATNKLISGSEEQTQNHDHRWKWDGEKWDYTSALLVDYESVLSAVWAKQTKQESEYIAKCRERDHLGQSHDAVPEMVVDKLSRIWSTVFPHVLRQLNGPNAAIIKAAIDSYLPVEIPH